MRKVLFFSALFTSALLAVGPWALLTRNEIIWATLPTAFATINTIGWIGVLFLLLSREEFKRGIDKVAKQLGLESRFKSLERVVELTLAELSRRHESLSINLVQQKINSSSELTTALERIVGRAYKLLDADSAEVALFDQDLGLYHSAFVLGQPFQLSAQAMLADAAKGEQAVSNPEVIIQPIAFAGSMLGTLRVALRDRRLPSVGDREVMSLLAVQAGLALMNAEYSQELLRMKKSADESIKAKTGFLANLSHEIRGPLGIMLNAVELVLDGLCGAISQDQLETLRMVHSNGQHLLELINDVLDYAKVESGRITPNKVDVLVGPLLEDVAHVCRGQAEAKKHKLVSKQGEEALAIRCDRRHLRQMLINLLTNSIKYTPEGGQIEVWAERAPSNKVKLCVKDSGVGIAYEDREKVFAPFERLDNAYSIKQVGAGLGMSLTRRLAEVNGGTIDFESQPGKGSTFWLAFPSMDAQDVDVSSDDDREIPLVDGRENSVLIIERNPDERSTITRYLVSRGFRAVSVGSKLEAVELLRSQPFDLTVMGNDIADSQDEDIVGLVRSNAKSSAMPLVLMSSRAFVFDIERYLKAGIDRCLVKPIKLKELAFTCRNLIDGTFSGEIVDHEVMALAKEKADQKRPAPDSPRSAMIDRKSLPSNDLPH